jgi:hypothetical protein
MLSLLCTIAGPFLLLTAVLALTVVTALLACYFFL